MHHYGKVAYSSVLMVLLLGCSRREGAPAGRDSASSTGADSAIDLSDVDSTVTLRALAGNDLDAYIASLPQLPTLSPPPPDPVIISQSPPAYQGSLRCDQSTQRQGASLVQLAAFAPNADVLWPGSIVTGGSIEGGVLTAVSAPRGKLTLVLGNIGLPAQGTPARPLSFEVKKPELASVANAAQKLALQHEA